MKFQTRPSRWLQVFVLPLAVSAGLARADVAVSVSGTVKSNLTGKAIGGATVTIPGLGLNTVTDSLGHFSITGPSGVERPPSRPGLEATAAPKSILFHLESGGPVTVRILDLAGTQKSVLHSGPLSAGTWAVVPPALGTGVYLCRIETPFSIRSTRFLGSTDFVKTSNSVSPETPEEIGFSESASRASAAAAVDSLVVAKGGYRSARLPLASYQQTGLAIGLDDTSSTNFDETTIVPDPSWTAYMPDGIPPPKSGTAVFSITLQIDAIHDVGITKFGHRRQLDIKGGSVTGDNFTGTVQSGGLDYELTLSNGSVEVEQINIIKAGTTPILMRNAGVAPIGARNARIVLDFEAPNSSSYAWLNTGKFAATRIVDTIARTIRLDVYDISKAVLPAKRVQIQDPPGVVDQTWDCVTLTGGQGTTVFTETVSLASSVSIGASKRGSRNIIPITGGTTTGRVVGKILGGGADYQLSGLDARYTLAPNDGEFIIVRNCGANGLVPVFEARVDGPYAFLNEVKYLSSSPTMVGSGVSITFYEKK